MRIWRISGYADLLGVGGLVSGGRWHVMGTPIVYCADHPATALLEILVHVDAEDMPQTYQLVEIEMPDDIAIMSPGLPDDWKDDLSMTQRLGTNFVAAATQAVMEVPCAIVPFTRNYLLNPDLLARDGIRIVSATTHPVDTRLLG
ncbi:RES family NAD+ phosphorylase [Mesorhizobium muleiense]|uniref:RES domain-containing protein n=1 Tax=Mesorhizobium muleiense TaxID=1004279 RepID=A0A1G8JPG8_9HYPH|nr:RES family NAD+ phosphorylase [Mesorhizobium muleiense]MCF6100062.1 RES family NAD+ phosphorylase [Mesorhizobium muleiense]SDI33199.1 RES domain-containing protein [Mesorhizobium muleiense]